MKRIIILLLTLSIGIVARGRASDICIYGGTSASVTAAFSAAHEGCNVTLICPDVTIGGMTTGGLGQTDIGNKQAVTGLARQFYRKLGEHYGKLEQWLFEPHVAEEILMQYLDNPRIKVMQGYRLESVAKKGTRIQSITCEGSDGSKVTIHADQFIDCSYEGDLMAKAGVSYKVGREDNSVYSETWDGSQLLDQHQFPDGVDPFAVPGDPSSGLLWGISDKSLKPDGTGDDYVQSYNYRICLTDDPGNMIPIEKPADYDSTKYELLVRLFKAQPDKTGINDYFIWSQMPGHKTDINNRGAFSTDMIGMNHSYPEASWAERDSLIQAHKSYTLGLLWFYGHDKRVPTPLQEYVLKWGLPKDEYVRTDHWTHQLYIRECRRLVGEYVATQADCENKTNVTDGIGYAAYTMDSHNCERLVIEKDGKLMVKNEGDVQKPGGHPYPISYRSLTPKRVECTNLLVPVCLSASHIAYGSIRMEPVFLEMGQACGLAASMAGKGSVQEIDVPALQDKLANDPYLDGREPDTLIDEDSEYIEGTDNWSVVPGWGAYGKTYLRFDGSPQDNHLQYRIPESLDGSYDVYTFQQNYGCATTKFIVEVGGRQPKEVVFDRSSLLVEGQTAGEWVKLGTFNLSKGQGGSIKFQSDTAGIHADGLLFVKRPQMTSKDLRRYIKDSLDVVAKRCEQIRRAAYMEGTYIRTDKHIPGYEGYPVKLFEYYTGKDVYLGKPKKALVYLLDPDAKKIARWIINAVWDVRGEVRYEDVEKVRKFILWQSGGQFPVKGVVYEAMYTPGFYEPYVFKDGVTVYIKDDAMRADDSTCTEEQLQFYLTMSNSDLKENTGRYARICSTTREMYNAAGGTDEVGESSDGHRSQAWLDTVRRLYLKAWKSDRNFLIYSWAKSNLN